VDSDGDTLLDGQEVNGWERDGQVFHTSPVNLIQTEMPIQTTQTPTQAPAYTYRYPNATATAQVIAQQTANAEAAEQQTVEAQAAAQKTAAAETRSGRRPENAER